MWHLQRVLAKKRDPLTHALFLDAVVPDPQDALPCDRVWCDALGTLAEPSLNPTSLPAVSLSRFQRYGRFDLCRLAAIAQLK